MSRRTKFRLTLFGLLIAVLGWTIQEWIVKTRLTAALASSSDRRHTLQTNVDRLRRQVDQLEGERGGLERDLNAVRLKAGTATEPHAQKSPTATRNGVRHALIDDPQFQNLVLAARRATGRALYGPLFEKLRLSSEQTEQFENALLRSEETRMDSSAVRDQQALAADDPVLQRLEAQNQAEVEQAQKAILGEAGYRELKDYERSLPARKAVDEFAGKAALAGAPLTSDQAERLTQFLAQTSPTFREGGAVESMDWAEALAPATAVLSSAQLEIIRRATAPVQYLQKIQTLAQSPR